MHKEQKIFKARIYKVGLTYTKLSELLNVCKSHFTQMLNGDRRLTEKHEERLNIILTEYEETLKRIEL
jgi:plasmid maintenance system antidote protein VapI